MTRDPDKPGDGGNAHYGLRIEADRSWTVYHVYTGVPAGKDGHEMAGLDRAAAMARMLAMNLRSASRHERITLDAPKLEGGEIDVRGWR